MRYVESYSVDADIVCADDGRGDNWGWLYKEAGNITCDSSSDGSDNNGLYAKDSALEVDCGKKYKYANNEREADLFGREGY